MGDTIIRFLRTVICACAGKMEWESNHDRNTLPLSYPSSGLLAVSFIYSHFHSDSAALSATYRMNTLPLAHNAFLHCSSGFVQYRKYSSASRLSLLWMLDRKH